MKEYIAIIFVAASASAIWPAASFAHITLHEGSAAAGAGYRAVFRVGHGCDGSPTTGISVTIPDGFLGAQPMPKPGWTLTTRMAKLAQPLQSHGKTLNEEVQEITWSANGADNYLPAAFYDEFVLRGTAPKAPGALWFKVVQTCENGQNAWVQIPPSGTSTKDLKNPAALLEVREVLNAPSTSSHLH